MYTYILDVSVLYVYAYIVQSSSQFIHNLKHNLKSTTVNL